MLESVLADVLTRVLGQYLEGIDRDSVRFGAWSGQIELRGVALRPEALAVLFEALGMDLPVTVEAGFIGLLSLHVPWNAIGTTPVQIYMEDIIIMARPVRGDGSDQSELQFRERRIKRAKLNTDDAVREASWGVSSDADPSTNQSSWTSWLVNDQLRAKIIDNVQVHLKDIIIRFEDPLSDPRRPYVASIACESLNIISVNQQWKEAFVERGGDPNTRKLLEIRGFRIDWAPITPGDAPGLSRGTSDTSQIESRRFSTPELLKDFVVAGRAYEGGSQSESSVKNILHSVDGFVRLTLSEEQPSASAHLSMQEQKPAADLDIRFPGIVVELDDVQYACMLQTSVYFARLSTKGIRPTSPKARWLWAIDQLLPGFSVRRAQALRFTEEGLSETRKRRIVYIAARKSLLKARRTGIEEPKNLAEDVERMEDNISFPELLAHRDMIDRIIETEKEHWRTPVSSPIRGSSHENAGTTVTTFWDMLGYSNSHQAKPQSLTPISVEPPKTGGIAPDSGISVKTNSTENSKPTLSLRVAFLLRSATIKLSQDGFPLRSVPRVALNMQDLRVGVLLSSEGKLLIESVLGSVEAWDIRKQTRMVYSRMALASELPVESESDHIGSSYPMDVTDAIDSIRFGSNPATEVLQEEEIYSDDDVPDSQEVTWNTSSDDAGMRDDEDLLKTRYVRRRSRSRRGTSISRESTPPPTFRVTESEFLGTRTNASGAQKYVAAFRYAQMTTMKGVSSTKPAAISLDVSVATLEAIVDGPKGSFLWGLKFWQPKGMAQDPIMAFLGAAAGARIAELRMEVEEALLASKVPMQINAVIMAPRFVIPSAREADPSVVVNMGTLGICTSDDTPTLHSNLPGKRKKRIRYSNYIMTLDDLGIYYSPDLSTAVSSALRRELIDEREGKIHFRPLAQDAVDTSRVERVIRPFSLRFVLQTLRHSKAVQVAHAPNEGNELSEDGIAKVRIRGNIPGLSLVLTQNAFQHLLVATKRWSHELRPSRAPERNPEKVRDYGLDVWPSVNGDDSVSGIESIDDADLLPVSRSSTSYATNTGTTLASFDIRVILNKVSLELRESSDVRLVTAVASRIGANIVKTGKTKLSAMFSLRSWSVTDDSRGSTAAFRRLAHAGTFYGSNDVSTFRKVPVSSDGRHTDRHEDIDFVSVHYSLDFASNVQSAQIRFLSLNLVCVRETYTRLAVFFRSVREYVKSRKVGDGVKLEIVGNRASSYPEGKGDPTALQSSPLAKDALPKGRMSVTSEFDGFNFQLVASGGAIAVIEMQDSKINFLRDENSLMKAWGDFRYFSVQDLTSPIDEHVNVIMYEKGNHTVENLIVPEAEAAASTRDGFFARDEWTLTFPRSAQEVYCLQGNFKGFKMLFLYRFGEVIRDYISALLSGFQPVIDMVLEQAPENYAVMNAVTRAAPESARNFFQVDLKFRDLCLHIPRHSSCHTEALNISVSQISLCNLFNSRNETEWEFQFREVRFALEYLLLGNGAMGNTSVSSTFLTDFEAQMSITLAEDGAHTKGTPSNVMKVAKLQVKEGLHISLCEAQYTVLYFVLTENFSETINEIEISTGMEGLCSSSLVPEPFGEGSRDPRSGNVQPFDLEIDNVEPLHMKSVAKTIAAEVSIPYISIEISRGWDVSRSDCKVVGFYFGGITVDFKVSADPKLVIEVVGQLHAISDLTKAQSSRQNVAVPLWHSQGSESDEVTWQENIEMTYEKKGLEQPSIVISLVNLQMELALSLLRDLTYLAVPGWPFLQSSAFAPDYVYLGRNVNIVLRKSQVMLFSHEFHGDRRALVFSGEFQVKMDWMRKTGAKRISLFSSQIEVSTLNAVAGLMENRDRYGIKRTFAAPVMKTKTPLVYPTDSFIEYVGPEVDDSGCRLDISVDNMLCLLSAAEIPLLRAIIHHASSTDPSYLSERMWVQPSAASTLHGGQNHKDDPKEENRRIARESMNLLVSVPSSRYLITDDRDGLFVPVLETRISSFQVSAHAGSMVQVEGQLSVDLFNSQKGWWEPLVEPWHLAASMSRGQSGAHAYVIRSEKRLNVNITPVTVTAAMTVAKAIREVSRTFKNDRSIGRDPLVRRNITDQSTLRRPSVAAFLVQNELGIPVSVTLPSSSRKTLLAQGEEVEVEMQSERLLAVVPETRSREKALQCAIGIESYSSRVVHASEIGLQPLLFSRSGTKVEIADSLEERKELLPDYLNTIWAVEMDNGIPICTIRSPLRIINQADTSLELCIAKSATELLSITEQDSKVFILKPGDSFPISILQTNDLVFVRPTMKISPGKVDRVFDWSTPLPERQWLRKTALELSKKNVRSGGAPQNSGMRFREHQQILTCKACQENSCDFYLKVVPVTSTERLPQTASECPWVDITLRAPIIVENKLPRSLAYQVFQRNSVFPLRSSINNNGDVAVLAAGVIAPLQQSCLYFAGASSDTSYLSLSYDNAAVSEGLTSRDAEQETSQFGAAASFGDLESGRVRSMYPFGEVSVISRRQKRRDFRASVESKITGSSKFIISAGVWMRNRSDTTLEVCSRGSFYAAGSALKRLRARDPLSKPDDYICCEGPYLSVRLPRNGGAAPNPEDVLDHSNWWTTASVLYDLDKPVTINLPGKSLELEVRPARGLDCNTFIATIRNSSWLVNNTPSVLQWCQDSALDAHGNCRMRLLSSLPAGKAQGVHWDAKSSQKAIHLRLAREDGHSDWIWSPPIPLNIGFSRELPAKMYRPKTQEQYIARVASKAIAGDSKALVVYEEDRQHPPYKIVNLCKTRAVAFSQVGSQERPWLVRAGKSTRYSWDDPLASPRQRLLTIRILEKQDLVGGSSSASLSPNTNSGEHAQKHPQSELNIDEVGERVMVLSASYDPSVVISVSVEGATKIVTFCDDGTIAEPTKSLPAALNPSENAKGEAVPVVGWDDIGQGLHETPAALRRPQDSSCDYPCAIDPTTKRDVQPKAKIDIDAAVFLDSVGISVVDADPCEILYVRFMGLLLNFESYEDIQSLAFYVQEFQVDNQLHQTPYPVLLWVSSQSRSKYQSDQRSFEPSPDGSAILIEIHRNVTQDDILMIRSLKAEIPFWNLSFEDKLISKILCFVADSTLFGESSKKEILVGIDEDHSAFTQLLNSSVETSNRKRGITSSRRIYVHDFRIGQTSLRLTSSGSGAAVAKAAGIDSTARSLVGLLLNVENCEFAFPSLSVQNVFDSLHHFGVLVSEYYLTQLNNQRMKLLASNSFVGNPAALFDAVGTGARDFFNEPGRSKKPADFISNVGRGSKSLLTNTVGGIMDSVSSIPRAVSSGIEKAVGDRDYVAERRRIRGSQLASGLRTSSARNPAQGLATGAISFAHGISSGVTGLIREPVQGAREGGATGLFKGIGKAVVGGLAKTAAGTIDLVAEPVAGFSKIGDVDKGRDLHTAPERPPRAFRGKNRRLEIYDRRYAVGVCLYRAVQLVSGVSYDAELIDWVELSDRTDRNSQDADGWIWFVVQKYCRSMPGAKKQGQQDMRSAARVDSKGRTYDTREEKTRVALLTMSNIVIATLDCKLVTSIPLWNDAKYEMRDDGKDLLLRTVVLGNGNASQEGAGGNISAAPLISAPWDALVVGRRKKPNPGEQVVDRIACGSSGARDDLRKQLRHVTEAIEDKRTRGASLQKNTDHRRGSGQELEAVANWAADNETEMTTAVGSRVSPQMPRVGNMTWSGEKPSESLAAARSRSTQHHAVEKKRTTASLERTVRRLSVGMQRSGGDSKRTLRVIIASRLNKTLELRLLKGNLDEGTWKEEPPTEIVHLDAKLFEVVVSDDGKVPGRAVNGFLVYEIVDTQEEDEANERIGEIALEFFCGKDAAASFTTKASKGFQAEFEQGSASHGTLVFTVRQTVAARTTVGETQTGSRWPGTDKVQDRGRSASVGSSSGGASRDRSGSERSTSTSSGAVKRESAGLSEDEMLVQQLVDIGFKFEDAVAALADAGGNLVKAVDILTSGQ